MKICQDLDLLPSKNFHFLQKKKNLVSRVFIQLFLANFRLELPRWLPSLEVKEAGVRVLE